MTFASEQKLEIHLRDLITTRITAEHPYIYALGNKMAVDIVICRDRERPAVFFLEVKLFQPGHNRLGIGAGKGNGYQPEIIAHTPEYFDKHLRWIIVDGDRQCLLISLLQRPSSGNSWRGESWGISRTIYGFEYFLKWPRIVKLLWLMS